MTFKKLALPFTAFLVLTGILLGQGPRKDIGTKVPVPGSADKPGSSSPSGADGPISSLSIDVNVVNVDVVVTDRGGNPISGLGKGDFRLFDDNVEQKITNFSPTEAPLTVVILVEFGRTIGTYYDNVVGSAAGFINSLRPEDWAALVAFDVRPEILTDFTKDHNKLFAGLSRMRTPAYSEAVLYDALIDTLERLDKIDGKKVVFLLSSGLDTISKHTYGDALRKAESSDAVIYPISLGQMARLVYQSQITGEMEATFQQADNVLRSIAESSGGGVYYPRFPTEYPAIYESIGLQMRNQYSLGFTPSNSKPDGKLHKLRVELREMDVTGDGKLDKLTVRHKKAYHAPKS